MKKLFLLLFLPFAAHSATITGSLVDGFGRPDNALITFTLQSDVPLANSNAVIENFVVVVRPVGGSFSTNLVCGTWTAVTANMPFPITGIVVPCTNATFDWLQCTTNVFTNALVPINFPALTNNSSVSWTNQTTIVSHASTISGAKGLVTYADDGMAAALTEGTGFASFLFDMNGQFSIQARSRANILTGATDSGDIKFRIDTNGNAALGSIWLTNSFTISTNSTPPASSNRVGWLVISNSAGGRLCIPVAAYP